MASYDPPTFITSIFNSTAFSAKDQPITLAYADRTYLKISGGSIFGSLNISNDLGVSGSLTLSSSTSHLYLTGASGGIDLTGNASQINLTGNSSHITLSGINSGLDLTGTNSTLQITGSGGHLVINNLEAGNASGSQGAIKCAGGAYFGNQVYINSNLDVQSLTFNGVSFNQSYYLNISTGIAGASKALVLDSSRNIVNINSLTASNLYGSIATASQPNITSLGTLTSLNCSGLVSLASTSINRFITMFKSNLANNQNVSFVLGRGGALDQQGEVTFTYNSTSGLSRLSLGHYGNPNMLNVLSSGNIGIGTNTPSALLDVNGTINTTSLSFSGVSLNQNYYLSITAGSASASKALVVDSSSNLSGINVLSVFSLSTTNMNSSNLTINGLDSMLVLRNQTAVGRTTIFFDGDVKDWELGSRNSLASSRPNTFYLYDNASSVYRLIVDGSGNVDIVGHNGSFGLMLAGVLVSSSATQLNYNNITTIGTGEANKALILDASRNITNINSLTSTSSIFTNLSTGNITLGGTLITATANQINYCNVSAGVASASKCLVLDSSRNIYNINRFTMGNDVSTLISNAQLLVNPASSAFSEIFFCSNSLVYGLINLKTTSMVVGTSTPLGGTASALEFVTDNVIRMKITGSGDIGIGNTSPSYKLDVSGVTRATNVLVGDSTDSARMISCLDSTQATNTSRYITLGKSATLGNQAEISFLYAGSNSSSNALVFGFYGGEKMRLTNAGYLGIGTTNPSFPLHVTTSAVTNYSGYGYLSQSGTSGYISGNSGNVNLSAYFTNRVAVGGEINIVSDKRKKKNIKQLDLAYCKKFVNEITPKSFQYNWIEDDQQSYGYIAQDIAKKGFHDLVNLLPDEGLEENIDDDTFVSPKDSSFVISTQNIIPILHMTIKDLYIQIEELKRILGNDVQEVQETNEVSNTASRVEKVGHIKLRIR